MSAIQQPQTPHTSHDPETSPSVDCVAAPVLSPCAGPRVSVRPVGRTPAYPIRTYGSSAGGRVVSMTQTFDSERGGFAPATFVRGESAHGMRLLTYVVMEILDMWQVPVPWWRPGMSTDVVGDVVGDVDQGCEDSSAQMAPMSRTVWRVLAVPSISLAGRHICGGVMDLAQDPDGTWSVVRIHG